MKPNFVFMMFILVCFVLDVPVAAADACGGCAEGQECRQYEENGIRVKECVVMGPPAPPSAKEAPKRPGTPCNETTCPPPKQCVTDNWAGSDYYCMDAPQGNPSNNQNGSSCITEFHARLDSCRMEVQGAVNSCDEKKDPGIESVNNQASQVAVMMGQMAAASIQAACSKMAKLTQAANAAVAAYQIACANAIESCKSACGSARSYVGQNALCLAGGDYASKDAFAESMASAVDQELEKCNSLTANVAQANAAIQNYVSTSANASQCSALSDGTGLSPEICKKDPKNPMCVKPGEVDCTKPEMATNKVCVCSRNPFDPMCSSGQKVGGGIGAGGGNNIDSSSRLANKADPGRAGDIPSLPDIEQGEFKDSGGAVGPDAEKVGNGGIAGGGGGGSSGGGRRAAGGSGGSGDDESSKVVSGFYGGGGGGSKGFGSGGYRGGGNNGGYVPGAGGVMGKGDSTPDLRKFLPGGQYDPRRMISGISGPDGITGPHSNIWQKVQNRYQILKPTLLP